MGFKTKCNLKGNIEWYKVRFVTNDLLKRMALTIKKYFCPFQEKKLFAIIIALVFHYDLNLHQMDVKTTFLNSDREKEIYMTLPEGLQAEGEGNVVYKLKISIYGFIQASRQ